MTDYRYSLGRKAARCPQCGRPTFKPYVDHHRGDAPLSSDCGRCNREIKCGYHLTPSQYFRDNPSSHRPLHTPMARTRLKRRPLYQLSELDMRHSLARADASPLISRLGRRYGRDAALRAARLCNVGATATHTAFWMVDADRRIRDCKLIAFDPDCHRRKTPGSIAWLHTRAAGNGGEFRSLTFFGSHLATLYPDALILVVESEKTALTLNTLYMAHGGTPTCIALATGGASMLRMPDHTPVDSEHRAAALRGRRICLIPDADMVDEWQSLIPRLRSICASVDLVDPRQPPYSLTGSQDLADYYL